jgi:hypothetical protein
VTLAAEVLCFELGWLMTVCQTRPAFLGNWDRAVSREVVVAAIVSQDARGLAPRLLSKGCILLTVPKDRAEHCARPETTQWRSSAAEGQCSR